MCSRRRRFQRRLAGEAASREDDGVFCERPTGGREARCQTATSLQAQADQAAQTAQRAQTRAGQLAANLYRDGSTNQMTTKIATAKDPAELLYQLGAMDQLTTTWTSVLDDASVAAGTASSLHDQATRAEAERARLAQAAEDRAAAEPVARRALRLAATAAGAVSGR